MDGAARTGGNLPERFTAGGRSYTLKDPGYLAFMEEAEAYIVSRRPNPLVEAAQAICALPPDLPAGERGKQEAVIRQIAEAAMLSRNRVTGPEIGAFMETRPGLIFTLWKFCPELTSFKEAEAVLRQMAEEMGEAQAQAELQARIDTVSGAVEAKNSFGPDPRTSGPGEPSDQTPSSNLPDGPKCGDSSPANTPDFQETKSDDCPS